MPTIGAFDPSVRYDDADKEAEAQRAAARDFMFRAQLQQQAAMSQSAIQNNTNASSERLGFADIADRGAGRAATLDRELAVSGSYKQKANDAAAHDAAVQSGALAVTGLQGQNQLANTRAGLEPQMGRLALEKQDQEARMPGIQAAANEAAAQSALKSRVYALAGKSLDGTDAPPVGGMYAPQGDPMSLYPKPAGNGLSPSEMHSLLFQAIGGQAPVDPNAAIRNMLLEKTAARQFDRAGSSDPAIAGAGAAGLKSQFGVDVGGGLSEGGLNTGNLDELSKVTSLVGPDIADLKSYSGGIHGWIGSGNEGHVLQAAASIKNKLDLAGASPAVKQQVLSDLYSGLTSSLSGTVYNLAGTDSLLAKLKMSLGLSGPASAPQVRPDAQ